LAHNRYIEQQVRLILCVLCLYVLFPTYAAAQTAQKCQTVNVVSGGPYSGSAGSPVNFHGSVAGSNLQGTVFRFAWFFGDQTGGIGASASHIYQQAGSYVAQLVVSSGTDSPGREQECVYTDTTTVTIGPPYAPLQVNIGGPYKASAGSPVAFTATTSGSAVVPDSNYQ
jgi:hypothetical protein